MQQNYFFLVKKFKNIENAQLWTFKRNFGLTLAARMYILREKMLTAYQCNVQIDG